MNSVTESNRELFFDLTPKMAMQMLEKKGRHCTGYCFALNSYENRVFELELEGGDRVVMKFYRPGRWTKEQIADEHRFTLELKEAEIQVGAPIALVGDETIFEVDGIFCTAFEKVRGRSPEDIKPEDFERMGQLVARVHNVGDRMPAKHRRRLTVAEYGDQSLDFLLGGFIPKHVEEAYVATAEIIFDWLEPRLDALPILRLHGDVHRGNVLENRDGYWLVDFDDMCMGPAVQDLWLLSPGRDDYAVEDRERLIKGYEKMRAFDRVELQIVEGLRALRVIHYSAWIARRFTDPAFLRVFDHFKETRYWEDELNQLREIAARL
jgi:Ser/Thr protein kinase RdoA (MazF antagonist)